MYLRDTLRLPAKGLSPSALPIFHQPASARGHALRRSPSAFQGRNVHVADVTARSPGSQYLRSGWEVGACQKWHGSFRGGKSAGAEAGLLRGYGLSPWHLGVRSPAHTQRRRKANAIATNPTGATPAIQSQWTKRPNSGLIVALATMATPTTSAAQKSENAQVLEPGGPVAPPPPRPAPVALFAISHPPPPSRAPKHLSPIPLAPFRVRKGKKLYLRDTLRLPAKGLSPSALPNFHQPAKTLPPTGATPPPR